jgi:hypothetical protein
VSDFIEVCGLWVTEKADGSKYMSGPAGKLRYFVFPNKSDNPKAPTHRLLVAKNEKREEAKDDDGAPF